MEIDVIIPLYKPGRELFRLLDMLSRQTVHIRRIILMNTEEKYFEQLVYGNRSLEKYKNIIEVSHLSKREFDHGRTRRTAVKKSSADIFVMMTQDAVPCDETLIEKLTAPFINDAGGRLAVTYARQLADENSSVLERFTRRFNYPENSCVKSAEDVDRLGIRAFFCSNVCAAYRRDIYDRLGGFVHRTIFNEDMIYAADAVRAGYSIAYVAEAQVLHSHNYTCRQQLKRNFDLGVSQAEHPEIFAGVPSEREGLRLVREATEYLRKNKLIREMLYFYLQCISKYTGYFLGRHYKRLPKKIILMLTANQDYWR
ncbi:MAG: glycosyltransferase family 2 protein [Lachnospiraceae bacterium]|nr:glycosyltransferase family 2 protein [Lachnospiraceae bacterium]